MGERLDDLAGAAVALVTFTRPRNLKGYRTRHRLAYPVLADEERAAYRAYGFGRGPWRRVYGLSTIAAYARLLRRGARLTRVTEDTLQLGGDVVVGPDGRIAWVFRSRRPDDRPAVDDLVAAVRAAAGGGR